jgi:phosphoserine phosphatase
LDIGRRKLELVELQKDKEVDKLKLQLLHLSPGVELLNPNLKISGNGVLPMSDRIILVRTQFKHLIDKLVQIQGDRIKLDQEITEYEGMLSKWLLHYQMNVDRKAQNIQVMIKKLKVNLRQSYSSPIE